MNYNKPMIDLVQEIRRRVPADEKPGIKLANPDLLSELLVLYHQSRDNVMRALTRELMIMAGDNWLERLEKPAEDKEAKGGYITKVYRGQTQLVEKKRESDSERKPVKRMYRGAVVVS